MSRHRAPPCTPRELGRWMLVLLLLASCQPSAAVKGGSTADPPPPEAPPASSSAVPAPHPPPAAVLRIGAPQKFRPSPLLLDLADESSLTRADFDARDLRAASPAAADACRAGTLLLALDEQSPRPLLAPSVPLRSIVDEDRELSPGWHTLVGFVVGAEDIEYELVHFQLELGLPRPPSDPACVLLAPLGTVHGEPGRAIELIALPAVDQARSLEYFVGGQTLRTSGPESAVLLARASGDHRVGARAYGDHGALLGDCQRTVTVNLKGPVPP